MAEECKQLEAAGVLGSSDELGTVLQGLGSAGDAEARLAAVVALLTRKQGDSKVMAGGAFAGLAPATAERVTDTFTSALHSCLRERAVNAGSPAITRSV